MKSVRKKQVSHYLLLCRICVPAYGGTGRSRKVHLVRLRGLCKASTLAGSPTPQLWMGFQTAPV